MKKIKVLAICSLILLFSATMVHAQQGGFTGPMMFGQQPASFAVPGFQGFMGPSSPVSVNQVVMTFPNKAQAVMTGNIVQHLGSDRYLFRDSTGEVMIKIKHDRWWGLSVGPNDLVEIGGELKREKNGWIKYFDAKVIRRAI
ncbi:MAG: NirD/YgiW/YdeI family stress tolerance protein [Treponema sp.]|nr:NirD/YgiW/YdeI family stress tolerance protein [Treponema sp.]